MKTLLACACLLFTTAILAQDYSKKLVHESVQVSNLNHKEINLLLERNDLVFDHFDSNHFDIHGPTGLQNWLNNKNINFRAESSVIPEILSNNTPEEDYPSSAQVEKQLKELSKINPKISKLFSVGKSHKGNELWVMKLSDNVTKDEVEPEFVYISSMHGNEITGRGLMLRLIEDLLKAYGQDPLITRLIDKTEIYIMPSMNPDGSDKQRRGNAKYVDLNRDFPDFSTDDNINSTNGREPETKAIMDFYEKRNFALSANFHGGAEVINYPWDTVEEAHEQEALIKSLSLDYSTRVPYMYDSPEFPKGIINGYEWYEVDGGMQDWSTHYYNCIQLTVELSDQKWPDYSEIPSFYQKNKEALIHYMLAIHQGAGIVLNEFSEGESVQVIDLSDDKLISEVALRAEEFYTVLQPGIYKIRVLDRDGKVKSSVNKEVKAIESIENNLDLLEVNYGVAR